MLPTNTVASASPGDIAGEEYTAADVRNFHINPPVTDSSAYTYESTLPTNSRPWPSSDGDEYSPPSASNRQICSPLV